MVGCTTVNYSDKFTMRLYAKNIVENSDTPLIWFYGINYWDIVIDFLNQDFASLMPGEGLGIAFPNNNIFQLIINDLKALSVDEIRRLVDRLFIDDSYPNLTASQKYYAYAKAVKIMGGYFAETLEEFAIVSFDLEYEYDVMIKPEYTIVDDSDAELLSIATDAALGYAQDEDDAGELAYSVLCEELEKNQAEISTSNTCSFKSLHDAVIYFLFEMINKNITLKKCPNCGRYFIPPNRSDTVYCQAPAPQMPTKTCQEFNKYSKFLKRTQEDEAIKLYRQIFNQKNNKVRRCKTADNPAGNLFLNKDLNDFKNAANCWKADVKGGTKTEADYIEWLTSVKEKKV